MPGVVTVGDLGLCCCVPCLSSAITPLYLMIDQPYGQGHITGENLALDLAD